MKGAKADAAAGSGGSAGNDGSAGNGGSAGIDGSAGAGASGGSAGAPDAGGAGGSDAADSGPSVICASGGIFDVVGNTNTQGRSGNLFAVGNGAQAYAVMGTDDGKHVLVQTVTDQVGASRLGNSAFVDVAGNMKVTGAQLSGGTLQVTGYGTYGATSTPGGIVLSFNVMQGLPPTPDNVDIVPAPNGCTQVRGAFYRYDSLGARHSALSCLEGSNGPMDLYVDGKLVGSNPTPDGTYEVTDFALSHSEYVVLTGESPGQALVFHAPVGSPGQFGTPAKVQFEVSSPGATWPMAAWESTTGTSLLVLEANVTGGGFATPVKLYQGAFSNLDNITQVPPPMTAIEQALTAADIAKLHLYGKPSPVGVGEVLVGSTFPAQDSIVFGLFSSADGTPLLLDHPVVQATSSTQVFPSAAAASLGPDPLIVWNDYDSAASKSVVRGQVFHCTAN